MDNVTKSAAKGRKGRVRMAVTGLRLDRDLVKKAKFRALEEDTSLTKLLDKAIDYYLRNTRP